MGRLTVFPLTLALVIVLVTILSIAASMRTADYPLAMAVWWPYWFFVYLNGWEHHYVLLLPLLGWAAAIAPTSPRTCRSCGKRTLLRSCSEGNLATRRVRSQCCNSARVCPRRDQETPMRFASVAFHSVDSSGSPKRIG